MQRPYDTTTRILIIRTNIETPRQHNCCQSRIVVGGGQFGCGFSSGWGGGGCGCWELDGLMDTREIIVHRLDIMMSEAYLLRPSPESNLAKAHRATVYSGKSHSTPIEIVASCELFLS